MRSALDTGVVRPGSPRSTSGWAAMRTTAATSYSSWRVYIPASANLAIDAIGPDTSNA